MHFLTNGEKDGGTLRETVALISPETISGRSLLISLKTTPQLSDGGQREESESADRWRI
jgi:hypothetical protein